MKKAKIKATVVLFIITATMILSSVIAMAGTTSRG